ncbi:metal-dependent phosphohydrolase [Baekduia alba]|uniref:hypothetical protein n=1 Tax=Baekduia alba TaxID=2997333 RepID=UPI0023427594|nr:hypothetical protein [Baekduia alba]WCB95203.1 metal-dependent phosphohydrolase [Baekduia alba]
MDPAVARDVAQRLHGAQRTRFGDLVVDHLARVAAAVPVSAQAVAWLHDVREGSSVSSFELQVYGLTLVELEALGLLTHVDAESYELYVLRIARARGATGRLARTVKLADLDDHLAHTAIPADAPPYAWARRRVAVARARDVGVAHASVATRAR